MAGKSKRLLPYNVMTVMKAAAIDGKQTTHPFPADVRGGLLPHIDPHSVSRAIARITTDAGAEGVHLHDARTACRTWMKANGISSDIRDAVLGHVGSTVGERVYEAASPAFIENRVRPALQSWADHVIGVVESKSTCDVLAVKRAV